MIGSQVRLLVFISLVYLGHLSTVAYSTDVGKEIKSEGRAGYVTINGKEYYVDDVVVRDWTQASDFCTALSMTVMGLETQIENTEIYQYLADNGLSDKEFWTCGTLVVEQWMWVGSGVPFTYTNWAPGEPNSTSADICVHTTSSGWADDDCYQFKYYICESSF